MGSVDIHREKAIAEFWEGMRDVAAAATRYRDDNLFKALRKIGRAVVLRGVQIPGGGLFVPCPICKSVPGQSCINVPRHPLDGELHPERVELAEKAIAGEVQIPEHEMPTP
ncbi:hypothetical protein RMN56_19460 [Micromonospora halotolerans]|uniref:DNA-binding phage zinc finger domain-containing protein n=1 Tax=Micromonospora halotolerans TaxID=709879 RepID=A0ABY9ZPY3_9ACTN|nr:hypothetical protein [Micromonospora halotolerans]WNM37346.1 hypothetical protein RMN56_19460 [Micromonospora halotolerans]